jgi:hypothetical protein
MAIGERTGGAAVNAGDERVSVARSASPPRPVERSSPGRSRVNAVFGR